MFFNRKRKGMSFAELVIVFAIIGAVSAMTLPSLKRYSQRTELAAQAKKAYENIEDAVDNAILSEGPVRNWDFSLSNEAFFKRYISPNLRTVSSDATEIVTVDGMKMSLADISATQAVIEVDVNNTKAPNVNGKDIFQFIIEKDNEKVVPSSQYGTNDLWKNHWKFTDELWEQTW